MLKSVFILLLFLVFGFSNQAQVLKKITEKTAPTLRDATDKPAGEPCVSTEELENRPGKYFTADQYPWPAVRAEYFKKLITASEKATAKQTLAQIEKLEQQSRFNLAPAGGNWESTYSSEGYQYLGASKVADYRLQTGYYTYLCVNKKVIRNGEYNTVLRVYVNGLRLNSLSKFLSSISYRGGLLDHKYGYNDWKNYKAGVPAPAIKLFTYLECNDADLINTINSGKGYWQDIPENKIRRNTYDHVHRYWFVKKKDMHVLLPVSRKEYLEGLLEFYEREALYLPVSNSYQQNSNEGRKKYFGDLSAVLAKKKSIVNKVLKDNSEEWLSEQAVVNYQEDSYQNQKQELPEYSSDFTFRRFYDISEKYARALYKYNPAYFNLSKQNMAEPELITIAFRYVPMPAHQKLIDKFTQYFDGEAWRKLLANKARQN